MPEENKSKDTQPDSSELNISDEQRLEKDILLSIENILKVKTKEIHDIDKGSLGWDRTVKIVNSYSEWLKRLNCMTSLLEQITKNNNGLVNVYDGMIFVLSSPLDCSSKMSEIKEHLDFFTKVIDKNISLYNEICCMNRPEGEKETFSLMCGIGIMAAELSLLSPIRKYYNHINSYKANKSIYINISFCPIPDEDPILIKQSEKYAKALQVEAEKVKSESK